MALVPEKMRHFEWFVNQTNVRSAYIIEPGLDIYIRKSLPTRGVDWELANIQARPRGKGHFTDFLNKYEGQYSFYVEIVTMPRFQNYLARRGYMKLVDDKAAGGGYYQSAPCYVRFNRGRLELIKDPDILKLLYLRYVQNCQVADLHPMSVMVLDVVEKFFKATAPTSEGTYISWPD